MTATNNPGLAKQEEKKRSVPTLRHGPLGWTIELCDADGTSIMNSAAYPTKFLAEDALARLQNHA